MFASDLMLVTILFLVTPVRAAQKPNFVFLHCESTDGRTYLKNSIVPIPNIRSLQSRGVNFENHYVNVPICCPSRASMWSGRQPHNIPHEHNGILVGGAWNNYEGVGASDSTVGVTVNNLIHSYLNQSGYNIRISGKTDWSSGGHSLTTMVDSWAIYSRFPYSIPQNGGWHIWGECGGNLSVNPGNKSQHQGDWNTEDKNLKWIAKSGKSEQPFFLYQGFGIVHPPYRTSQEWLSRIPQDKIVIPDWKPLNDLHPCDLQTSMKKGCLLPKSYHLNTTKHKRDVRAGYYAMIAEFDDMVGQYIKAIADAGLEKSTIFIVSSDHGDMQMEHQQFYKMVAYEASSHVPLVIAGPGISYQGGVTDLTSAVDLMPTILDLAGAPLPSDLDGTSLLPFLSSGKSDKHPDYIISQFHGENLVMSWYMVRRGEIKYVAWGTGKEHISQMFNLTSDPDEHVNLAANASYKQQVIEMDKLLRKYINYPNVSMSVAEYNLDMAKWWVGSEPKWAAIVNGTGTSSKKKPKNKLNDEWGQLWQLGPKGYWEAWNQWINGKPQIVPCPSNLTWNWPP